jgi:hypothetical protein
MEVWRQDGPGQVCAVEFDSANAEEQEQEVAVVVFSDAVVDPSAMMITSFNTDATQGAMLASCGLLKVAGTAEAPWSEEDVIVGVLSHSGCMIDGSEVVGLAGDAEVGKGIGSQQDKGYRYDLGDGQVSEGGMEEEGCTAGQEDEEQEEDKRVLLVKEVVGQPDYVGIHPATGIACIDSAEAIRDVDAQKPVTEADGSLAESWETTEQRDEGEKRYDHHQDDGVAKGHHDKLRVCLILSTSEKLMLACEVAKR